MLTVSHFKVRPRMQQLVEQREQSTRAREEERTARIKVAGELKAMTAKWKETSATLTETETQLIAANSQVAAGNGAAKLLKEKLAKVEAELKDSQQKLARWDGLTLDPLQVRDVIASEKNLRTLTAVLKEEIRTWTRVNARLTNIVFQTDIEDPILPTGLKGQVLVVDPKWDFVILDIGHKQGVLEKGVLMVSRNRKLIAKVRVTDVQAEKSIANIMPGWKLSEVMEGDQAVYLR